MRNEPPLFTLIFAAKFNLRFVTPPLSARGLLYGSFNKICFLDNI